MLDTGPDIVCNSLTRIAEFSTFALMAVLGSCLSTVNLGLCVERKRNYAEKVNMRQSKATEVKAYEQVHNIGQKSVAKNTHVHLE